MMIKTDSLRTLLTVVCLTLLFSLTSGCTATRPVAVEERHTPQWIAAILNQQPLPPSHPDHIGSILSITDGMRQTVRQKFAGLPKHIAIERLANWLIQEDGLNMDYDLKANLSPADAYEQRRGNCLSFTMLLATLAAELDIDIQYNQVFLPDIWNMEQNNGLFLYRHVNALYKGPQNSTVIFDLAMDLYDFGYPQKLISQHQIAAKLHSNRGAEKLFEDDYEKSFYYFSQAISISPEDSEIWGNLGALLKRSHRPEKAEEALLYSLNLNPANATSASNLERLYQAQGRLVEAEKYADLAVKARKKNPYYYYDLAKQQYDKGTFARALKSLRQAKKLHKKDPRFYELSGQIFLKRKEYAKALRDMKKAAALSMDKASFQRYSNKAKLVAELAEKHQRTHLQQGLIGNLPVPIRVY